MRELKITEYKNVRVLTTQQIAEAYGADAKVLSNNFNRTRTDMLKENILSALKARTKDSSLTIIKLMTVQKMRISSTSGRKRELFFMQSPLTQTKHGKYMTDWWTRILRSRSL